MEYDADPAAARIAPAEVEYLCETVNRFFKTSIGPGDVAQAFSGVRPLIGEEEVDASAVSRDYQLELSEDGAPLLSVLGGKITTYRRLAAEAVDRLAPALGLGVPSWTEQAPLPGGDVPGRDLGRLERELMGRYAWLEPGLRRRLARAYGTRAFDLLGDASGVSDLGARLGADLFEREARYLVRRELARSADDILWRRTRLGLRFEAEEIANLERWLARSGDKRQPGGASPPRAR